MAECSRRRLWRARKARPGRDSRLAGTGTVIRPGARIHSTRWGPRSSTSVAAAAAVAAAEDSRQLRRRRRRSDRAGAGAGAPRNCPDRSTASHHPQIPCGHSTPLPENSRGGPASLERGSARGFLGSTTPCLLHLGGPDNRTRLTSTCSLSIAQSEREDQGSRRNLSCPRAASHSGAASERQ